MQCTLCNHSTIEIYSGEKLYHRCRNCDFIFLDHCYILDNEEEKRRYSFHKNTIDNVGYVEMFENFFEKIFVHTKRVQTILDFGCGPGPVMAQLLKQKGYEVSLYDIYFYDKKENLEKKYDVVISTEVFEHLKNPKNVMQNLVNLLNPNGYLALMTQFHPQNDQKFDSWYYKIDETHIGFFTPKTFEFLAQELDLKVIFHDNTNSILLQKQF